MFDTECLLLISGPIAVGKTTLSDYLISSCGFDRIRTGSFLNDLALQHGKPTDRRALQELGDRLDQETDYEWVIKVARDAMSAKTSQRLWLFDSVRKRRQVLHFRKVFQNTVCHLHLDAPKEILRERYQNRKKEGDQAGNAHSYESAIAHPNEIEARSLIEIADIIFDTTYSDKSRLIRMISEFKGGSKCGESF